jgi:hypothetical protein
MKTPRQQINNKKSESKAGERKNMGAGYPNRVFVSNENVETFKEYLWEAWGFEDKLDYKMASGDFFSRFKLRKMPREHFSLIQTVADEL